MALPRYHMGYQPAGDYRVTQYNLVSADGRFPPSTDFPNMVITRLQEVYLKPFGPPVLASFGRIITDYRHPWEQTLPGWCSPVDGNVYRAAEDFDMDDVEFVFDTAFYLDHSVSHHWGHFITDCLSRIYAYDTIRKAFGTIKVVLADQADTAFQIPLLEAAGIPRQDIIKITRPIRCKCLLLATPSLGLAKYASPTSVRLWADIRDRIAVRDDFFPRRIYFSRGGLPTPEADRRRQGGGDLPAARLRNHPPQNIYSAHARSRKSAGEIVRKLSVTLSQ
jgi:hypothetical protein